jgi:hypothetical protein
LNADHVLLLLTHLNVPYGPVLGLEHLQAAIRAGSLDVIEDQTARAIAAALFIECSEPSIMAAAHEQGVGPKEVEALYRSCVGIGAPRHPEWERHFEGPA